MNKTGKNRILEHQSIVSLFTLLMSVDGDEDYRCTQGFDFFILTLSFDEIIAVMKAVKIFQGFFSHAVKHSDFSVYKMLFGQNAFWTKCFFLCSTLNQDRGIKKVVKKIFTRSANYLYYTYILNTQTLLIF